MDEREVDVGTVLMGGRTGWEKRLEVEQGERGAVGLAGSAMPIRLAAACSRSIESCSSDTPGRLTGFFSKPKGAEISM